MLKYPAVTAGLVAAIALNMAAIALSGVLPPWGISIQRNATGELMAYVEWWAVSALPALDLMVFLAVFLAMRRGRQML